MIEMCIHYTTSGHPRFKPVCKVGHRAGLRCHSTNSCPMYSVSSGVRISTIILDEFANYPDFSEIDKNPNLKSENSP